jgi:hypothetical protein
MKSVRRTIRIIAAQAIRAGVAEIVAVTDKADRKVGRSWVGGVHNYDVADPPRVVGMFNGGNVLGGE